MKKDIQLNILPADATLRDILNALNQGVLGIIFITDDRKKLLGLFTDGDVRRALLQGGTFDSKACDFMVTNFSYGLEGQSKDELLRKLSGKVRHLPILNHQGQITDFLSWAEMWHMPIMEPTLGGNELKYISDCIATNWISSQGSYVNSFEKKFADYHGCAYSLSTSNGTAALHLALTALGVGPGDEVIVPDLTFGASANTVIHAGATPVFVDINPDSWTIEPERIQDALTAKTKAIMPVHLYGHPCDMDPIMDIAAKHGLYVVEDCAEALGAKYKNKFVGTIGDAGCFSFFSNKVITTGEGGMVITSNERLFERLKIWRDHGMTKEKRYWHEVPGFNYRMTNLQAAVGLAQLEQIDKFLGKRRHLAQTYNSFLKGTPGITTPPEMEWAHNIYWLYSILIDEQQLGISRDALRNGLSREGIETRAFFYPLHDQPPYGHPKGSYPVATDISEKGISLPSSIGLTEEKIQVICYMIKKMILDLNFKNDFCD